MLAIAERRIWWPHLFFEVPTSLRCMQGSPKDDWNSSLNHITYTAIEARLTSYTYLKVIR